MEKLSYALVSSAALVFNINLYVKAVDIMHLFVIVRIYLEDQSKYLFIYQKSFFL